MAMSDILPLAEVKNHLSEVVEEIERTHQRVVLTKHGRPAVVLISVEDLESLEATLEITLDPLLMKTIQQAHKEISNGGGEQLTKQEALQRWDRPSV